MWTINYFINLTPFIPLSFKGEGEEVLERGFAPLLPTLPLPLLREGGQGDRLLNDLDYIPDWFERLAMDRRRSQLAKAGEVLLGAIAFVLS